MNTATSQSRQDAHTTHYTQQGEALTLHFQALEYGRVSNKQKIIPRVSVYIVCLVFAGVAVSFIPGAPPVMVLILSLVGFGLFELAVLKPLRDLIGIGTDWSAGESLQTFCRQNGFVYATKLRTANNQYIPSVHMPELSSTTSQLFSGKIFGHGFESYLMKFALPAQGESGMLPVRVFHITFGSHTVLPPLYVSLRPEGGLSFEANVVPRTFQENQRLSLESSFEEKYVAYSHVGTKTDAVSFLPPNLIDTLIQTNQSFDFELVGDSLYVYSREEKISVKSFRAAFELLTLLTMRLDKRLQSWKMTLPNDTYSYMESNSGFQGAEIAGKRFNTKLYFYSVPLIIAYLHIWLSSMYSHRQQVSLSVLVTGIFVGGLVVLGLRRRT